jgi:lipopolysaccharide export system permease protein
MKLEIQRRFATPFACLIFALIAVPLGIQNRRSGKSAGFSLSIITLLTYYIFLSIGKNLGEKAVLTPFVAMWLPNMIFLAGGTLLFIKTAREERFALLDRINAAVTRIFRKRSAA